MGNDSSKDDNQDIQEEQLWQVSEKVMPGLQDKLADILGLRTEEVDEIRHASELTGFTEATFKMLLCWQEKQTTGNKADRLTKVLKDLDVWDKGLISPGRMDHLKYVVKSKQGKELTELQLHCVGNRITNEKFVPVGLFLGMPYKSIAADWAAANAHVKTATFRMLCTWQKGLDPSVCQDETLAKVLEATHQHQLAEQVRKGIGLKITHYETRNVNLKSEKLNKFLGLDEAGRLCFVSESGDMAEKARYVVNLHIFTTSKTDKIDGSPALLCLSEKFLRVNKDGCPIIEPYKVKVKDLNRVDDWFFLHQTLDDGSFVLKSCYKLGYICADESGTTPSLGSLDDAVRFSEILIRR